MTSKTSRTANQLLFGLLPSLCEVWSCSSCSPLSMNFVKHRRKVINGVVKYLPVFLIFGFIFCFTWNQQLEYNYKQKEKVDSPKTRPWYFNGGSVRPDHHDQELRLWPSQTEGDRISDQLMFVPAVEPQLKKKIYVEKLQEMRFRNGSAVFDELNCPVKNCQIVFEAGDADAVIFENFVTRVREKSTLNQVWILHLLESPFFSGKVIQQTSVNWTASYRLDSDLVTPYDKWVYYDEHNKVTDLRKNYASGRTKKVAWFVSNCHSKNKRLEYAKILQKYIEVDIYGLCGDKVCAKDIEESCREMMAKNYKFYLSFENANCRDYITEKFYLNALRLDLIPIVMGPPKEDYQKVAPLNSFIHVEDFPSPKHLADYLHFLDENDEAYNSYFLWKNTGEFINTYFMCRLCAMLHANRPDYFYRKIMHWWRKPETCTKTFWNKTNAEKIIRSLKSLPNG